jgi:hypothetical protein
MLKVKVLVVGADQTIRQTLTDQMSLSKGQSFTNSKSFNTSGVAAGDYIVILQGESGGVSQTVSSASLRVTASPNSAPDLGQARPSVASLWPPNHKMVDVSILGITDADGDPVRININRILQDEPTNSTGDGDTCPDAEGIGTSTVRLRAERKGNSNGRVYTIYFTASDGRGGTSQGKVKVCVPHNPNSTCIDDGETHDSTVCAATGRIGLVDGRGRLSFAPRSEATGSRAGRKQFSISH